MKKILTFTFILILSFFFAQKVELKKVTDTFQVFKGEIAGNPVTFRLNYDNIIDCHQYQHFVDGWYYYDKYKKKIPLTGIYNLGDLYLFNFGKDQKKTAHLFKEKINRDLIEKSDSIAKALNVKEIINIKGQERDKQATGNFFMRNKSLPLNLNTKDTRIYRLNDYITIPNHKKINTYNFINNLGGNRLVSYSSGKSGNRVLLYFEELSNFNYCGMCGAGDGEKGYRVIYFTNDWNFKSYEDFLIESCLESIYNTTLKRLKDQKILKFSIKKTSGSPAYILTVDIKNATVTKSK